MEMPKEITYTFNVKFKGPQSMRKLRHWIALRLLAIVVWLTSNTLIINSPIIKGQVKKDDRPKP